MKIEEATPTIMKFSERMQTLKRGSINFELKLIISMFIGSL